jgi:late competence protein required for DNA uptake (superfamily II DNA/RNA helicase)
MLASFEDFYGNPEYEIMNELLPRELQLKMKMSMFAQAWLPYLSQSAGKRMLDKLNFTNEYTEVKFSKKEDFTCKNCAHTTRIPTESFKMYCEKCFTMQQVKTEYNCVSCGSLNPTPPNVAKPQPCISCATVNNLVKAWF